MSIATIKFVLSPALEVIIIIIIIIIISRIIITITTITMIMSRRQPQSRLTREASVSVKVDLQKILINLENFNASSK